MAAVCQALDPDLPYSRRDGFIPSDILKLYNNQLQIYSDPKARHWLESMAECMVRNLICV